VVKFSNGKKGMEPWIETINGNKFWFDRGDTEGIDIRDIAHALSNLCRYTGHSKYFFSVAEHSINVALVLPKHKQLWGLLHDASEAYLADIASPVKQLIPEYKKMEEKIMFRIAQKFKLPIGFHEDREVKEADWACLKEEAKILLPSGGEDWYFPTLNKKGLRPMLLSCDAARQEFIDMYHNAL